MSAASEDASAPAAKANLPIAPGVHEIVLAVNGSEATGVFAVPDSPSSALIVFGHWFGAQPDETRAIVGELAAMGAYVVAMDYRGAVGSFNVAAGVEDTLAATEVVLRERPDLDEVVAYGFSMGGEVTAVVVARSPPGTFDHWVSGAGVMDLADEWTKMPLFRGATEAETGGTPEEVP